MLVLSRKSGESVLIDSYITIKVLEVRNGKVRLGIEAPPEVSIRRSELEKTIQEFEAEFGGLSELGRRVVHSECHARTSSSYWQNSNVTQAQSNTQ